MHTRCVSFYSRCRAATEYSKLIRRSLGFAKLAVAVSAVSIGGLTTPAPAEILFTGDHIDPVYTGDDPWNIVGDLTIGAVTPSGGGDDSLLINGGSSVTNTHGIIGQSPLANAIVTVAGVGSQWTNSLDLLVGGSTGAGIINIEDQAVVSVGRDTWAGYGSSSSGVINFDGGTLNTGNLYASAADLLGTGTINTHTILSDIDLAFNPSRGLAQQIILNTEPNQNITINLDASDASANRVMGAGYRGTGSLTIAEGISLGSDLGILGHQSGAQGTATVAGVDSRWTVAEDFHVGYRGTGTLNVYVGGTVESQDAEIGYLSGSNGTATVSGSGSSWTTDGDLHVGYSGVGALNVLNAGLVWNDYANIGYNAGSNGTVTVSGADSDWYVGLQLSVGRAGTGELNVLDGGRVRVDYKGYGSSYSEIGEQTGANGTVNVSGAGSLLDYRSPIYIGKSGTGILTVDEGGLVNTYQAELGSNSNAAGTVTVSGVGSRWESIAEIMIGAKGSGTLNILDGGVVSTESSSNSPDVIGDGAGAVGVVTVDGAGSLWDVDGVLHVGNEGSGTLNLDNGGVVAVSDSTIVGAGDAANGTVNFNQGSLNTLSLFASPTDLMGTGTINAQGVVSDIDIRFDQATGQTPQVIMNTQAGQNITLNLDASDTNVNNTLGAGFRGFGSLSITEGVSVSSQRGILGYHSGSQGTATIAGAGSQWTTRDDLVIGQRGLGILNIRDGGKVAPDEFYIGDEPNAFGIVDVKDSGSFLQVKNLYVGRHGAGALTIRDGALGGSPGYTYSMYIGSEPGSSGSVEVSGVGSSWQSGSIRVGSSGNGSLDVVQGGNISLYNSLNIGAYDGSFGEVNVSGLGSTMSLGTLYVGSGVLNIENAGVVESGQGRIGVASDAIGIATVTGPGSRWDILRDSYIGEEGSGTLNILNGASVNNVYDGYQADIGHEAGSIGRVNVSGTGSQWDIQGHLTVGNLGSGRLYIEDNAAVHVAYDTWVRKDPTATGSIHFNNGTLSTAGLITSTSELLGTGTINTGTIVSDVDLVFDQNSGLQQQIILNALPDQNITLNVNPGADPASNRTMGLGYFGSGSMTLADGLSLSTISGILGYHTGSTGTANITGDGTEWINNELLIGRGGDGTLTIMDGGHVKSDKAYLGYESGSTGAVIVSGAGSSWDNTSSNLYIAYDGSGSLTINDGGQVNSGVSVVQGGGSATVSGTGSRWNAELVSVGRDSDSSIVVEDGAILSTGFQSSINGEPGTQAFVTVTGNGSRWEINSGLVIGHAEGHHGTLNILSGGIVDIQHSGGSYTYLGLEADSEGTVNVNGAGSAWEVKSSLYVGYRGAGTLNIDNGALITVEEHLWDGLLTGATGEINFNNGTLNTTSLNFGSANLLGTGTINTKTLLSDTDLLFDNSHGLQQQIVLNNEPNQNVTINIDYTAPASNLLVGAGYRGVGSMTVAEGQSITSSEGLLGYHAEALGTATIDGTGSSWLNTGDLKVGKYGTGVLSIQNGGHVHSTDLYLGYESYSDGTIMIDGVGSQLETGFLTLGFKRSTGTVTVTNGGRLTTVAGRIGFVRNSFMDVTVSDPGSIWDTDGLLVGNEGTASLTIQNGGRVTSDGNVSIAHQQISKGEVTVTDPGSVLSINGSMTIRGNTSNTLNVSNGGVVESLSANVGGYNTSGNTVINIGGTGSQWLVDGALGIGVSGNAEINIQEGGLLDTQEISVGATKNTRGIVNQTGGTVRLNAGDLQLANGDRSEATYNLNGGTLDMRGNNITFGIGDVHQFNFNGGTLKDAASISLGQAFEQLGGTLAPGGSIGQTDILGDYTLTAGTVQIEFGGVGNPSDLITATGDIDIALLGTTLDLAALGPMSAGTYTIIESSAGTISGMFEFITGIGLDDQLVNVSYESDAITITLSQDFVPSDLNGDGFVGIDDLNTVLVAWNQDVTPGDLSAGDANGDGYVGIGDLTAVLANWNTGVPPPHFAASTPEPASLAIVLLAMTCHLRTARRDRP